MIDRHDTFWCVVSLRVFFLLVCALTHPAGSSKYGTSREKYATILQIKTSNELCALLDTTGKLRILSIYYRYMHILMIFVFEKEGIMLTMVGQFAVFFLCFRGLYGYIFFRMRVLIEDKKDIVFV